jgi:hypothetical protein
MTNIESNNPPLGRSEGWPETALSDAWQTLVCGESTDDLETVAFVRGVVEELAALERRWIVCLRFHLHVVSESGRTCWRRRRSRTHRS